LIRHEAVKWPDFISSTCQSFIQVSQFFMLTVLGFPACMNSFIFSGGFLFCCFQIGFTTEEPKAAFDMAAVVESSLCEEQCPGS
jgi:hypothetical protein